MAEHRRQCRMFVPNLGSSTQRPYAGNISVKAADLPNAEGTAVPGFCFEGNFIVSLLAMTSLIMCLVTTDRVTSLCLFCN